MKKQDFHFDLPQELIAQYPLAQRSDSRLLVYSRESSLIEHRNFNNILDYLTCGDVLVMNDTRVIPARLYGKKSSGGKVELLVERLLTSDSFLAHIKASKALRAGMQIILDNGWIIEVTDRKEDLFVYKVDGSVEAMLEQIGHIPLPPYIARQDENLDANRYQTVYARYNGSVAAPTAGLHFDTQTLANLTARGVQIAYVTLHVGAGTFRPVRCEQVRDHIMHEEYYCVSVEVCDTINQARALGKRVVAVGTTTLRSLESAALSGKLIPAQEATNIFILPGFKFQVCDGLITNFHLPESTLLMLVSAFIGYEQTMHLYKVAIEHGYRFFSYGDACLLY